jgi:protein SCO1/2
MRKFPVSSLLLAAVLAACGPVSFRGTVLEQPEAVPDFTLTDQHGQPFRLSDQRGSVVLLFFGYTFCPDVCPTTLATWRTVHDDLGSEAGRVRFVFVTVDPERDTPERLGAHLNAFSPDFVGLTGTQDQLQAVYDTFGVYVQKQPSSGSAAGYLVSHTATTFVLDGTGNWRLVESYGTEAADIVYDIRQLLR